MWAQSTVPRGNAWPRADLMYQCDSGVSSATCRRVVVQNQSYCRNYHLQLASPKKCVLLQGQTAIIDWLLGVSLEWINWSYVLIIAQKELPEYSLGKTGKNVLWKHLKTVQQQEETSAEKSRVNLGMFLCSVLPCLYITNLQQCVYKDIHFHLYACTYIVCFYQFKNHVVLYTPWLIQTTSSITIFGWDGDHLSPTNLVCEHLPLCCSACWSVASLLWSLCCCRSSFRVHLLLYSC